MKLLVVVSHYPPDFAGGYELRCAETVTALRDAGHEVHVLTRRFNARNDAPHVYRLLNPVVWQDTSNWLLKFWMVRRRTVELMRNFAVALRVIDRVRPDGVLHWSPTGIGLGGALAAGKRRVPVVYFVGDMSLANYFQLFRGKWLDRFPSLVRHIGAILQFEMIGASRYLDVHHMVFNSFFTQNAYAQEGIHPQNARVIYNGIRYRVLEPQELFMPNRFSLLYAGRLVEEKGAHIAVEVLQRLHSEYHLSEAHLTIVGGGDRAYEDRLRAQAEQAGLGEHVRFLGKLPPEEMPTIYRNHRALLFPVLWEEPFGLVLAEAMAHGVPPVASRSGAVPEIVRDGLDGFVVAKADIAQMAQRTAQLLQDDSLWQTMRLNGLERVKAHFTQQAYVAQVLEYLKRAFG